MSVLIDAYGDYEEVLKFHELWGDLKTEKNIIFMVCACVCVLINTYVCTSYVCLLRSVCVCMCVFVHVCVNCVYDCVKAMEHA